MDGKKIGIIVICVFFVLCTFLFLGHIVSSDCQFSVCFNDFFFSIGDISWQETFIFILLLIISISGLIELYSTLNEANLSDMKKSLFIGILLGGLLTAFIFWHPIIELLFNPFTSSQIFKIILGGGGFIFGWFVWYLKNSEEFGDFFYVFLISSSVGFIWYSFFRGTTEVDLVAFSFLFASLLRLALILIRNDNHKEIKPIF